MLLVIPIERIAAHESVIVRTVRVGLVHADFAYSIHDLLHTAYPRENSSGEEAPFEKVQYVTMVKNQNGLLRIFWPNNLARTTAPGVIVGWRNSELDLFVVTILEDAEVWARRVKNYVLPTDTIRCATSRTLCV